MARTLAQSIGGTVRQRAVRELRDRILTGALQPGTRLDLDAITREFGVSRTPVREALLELSFQGLVEISPRSSVTVVGVSPDATLDNFAIFAALSGKAAEWAATRITPDELRDLEQTLTAIEGASGGALLDANWKFHRIINAAARSEHLVSLIRQAVRLIPSNFLDLIPVHDNAEHAQLLEHLRRGRAAKARVVAEQHTLTAGKSLADWLSQNTPPA